tara:strand:+ start:124 stop:348 length:225 start_codon:yes stop_codon:yes gene_type:complete
MAIETFNVSFTLEREIPDDDDDTTWYDEEFIATQISAWLYRGANWSTTDYNVTDITVNSTKFIKLNWAKEDTDV